VIVSQPFDVLVTNFYPLNRYIILDTIYPDQSLFECLFELCKRCDSPVVNITTRKSDIYNNFDTKISLLNYQ
jgi:hypothetical protein